MTARSAGPVAAVDEDQEMTGRLVDEKSPNRVRRILAGRRGTGAEDRFGQGRQVGEFPFLDLGRREIEGREALDRLVAQAAQPRQAVPGQGCPRLGKLGDIRRA